jgi:hypothetical protein
LPPTPPRRRRPQGGKVLDPEWCRERARRARAAQDSPDRLIAKIVDLAPALSQAQRDRLALLLRGGR